MRYILILLGLLPYLLFAQGELQTVNTKSANTHQVWYSFEKGEVAVNELNSWDLGFSIAGFMPSIMLNTAKGHQLWLYRNGDKSAWENLDTNGLSSWPNYQNSTKNWQEMAFNRGINASNELDLGWGVYNFMTHHVVGDSIFILKTNEEKYLKIIIDRLASGTYTIKYANLDGTAEQTATINKSEFTGKNFGYFNLTTKKTIDIEPLSKDWDLVFTKYIEMVPTPYPVFGVLTNKSVMVSKIEVDDVNDDVEYKTLDYTYDKNILGYAWKTYNFETSKFDIEENTVYILQIDSQQVWKMYFDGYEGSSTGIVTFYTEKLAGTTSIARIENQVVLYPNPSSDFILISTEMKNVVGLIYNSTGQLVADKLQFQNNQPLNISQLQSGVYFLKLTSASSGESSVSQLIKK